ncbi:MAG: VTC domain-containing protein [Tractidigestivibacter sp.]|jgi:hypothetical protein|uniref:VTC domain-containing protein n=1 Tax=Tractidigestivibacter sp. TaxID=2847320 RepID=UPI003D93EFE7
MMKAEQNDATKTPQVQMVFKRTECKYLLNDDQRARLESLMECQGHMVGDSYGPSTVRNIYLDTPTYELARRSEEHPYYKEKARLRSYRPVTLKMPVFVELKKKCNGIVYKRRCTLSQDSAIALVQGELEPKTQIEREIYATAQRLGGLSPAAYVAYDREAFYDANDRDLRMTFDRAVRVRWDHLSLASDEGERILPDGLSILEVKTSKAMPLWLVTFLTDERLFKTTFSKYGTAFRRRYPRGFRGLETQTVFGIRFAPEAASGAVPTARTKTVPSAPAVSLRARHVPAHALRNA